MPRIAQVVVDIALDREFDYRIPLSLETRVVPGSRVTVPFGHSIRSGFVIGVAAHSSQAGLKDILEAPDDVPLIDESLLRLARWMGEYYCVPVEQAVRSVLPAPVRRHGSGFRTQRVVRPTPTGSLLPAGDAETPLSDKQARLLALAREAGEIPVAELLGRAGMTNAPLQALVRKGYLEVRELEMRRSALAGRTILKTEPLALMPEQAQALAQVLARVEAGAGVVLLHGITGSGKTEVYLQAIDRVLQRGQGAIVLVPEIALTPQTVERFHGRFGERIAVLHSHLSDGERHDEWYRIRRGEADIVVGARSAVFAPVRRPGLIVVDEEHEPSYKQEEAPRYHARDVAVMRGSMDRCPVLLCSATPSLESWVNVQRGKYELSVLPRRADDRRLPVVRVVDMRIEAEKAGHACVFSSELLAAIRQRLERGEQTMLFLNRRGFATSLLCPFCGHVETCPLCSIAYTYHRTDERLRCHICGKSTAVPTRCPQCKDPRFRMAGIGTQRVEQIAGRCFPKAVIRRLDADVTTRKAAYEEILGDFRVGNTDILIGTQMIAKGLHFPNVTLVGIIYADLSLYVPDFRAGERTFQLLAQVAGRAGRGDVPGEVIVQTYTPAHPAVQAASRHDFEGFSTAELRSREELGYPPFAHLVRIGFRGRSESQVSCCATQAAGMLRKGLSPDVRISEAGPAPLARAKGFYRYHIIIRSRSIRELRDSLRGLARERRPSAVHMTVDVDAMNLG